MSAALLPVLKQRYFDSNGDPLSGGQLFSYIAGTTTPAATYTDQGGLTPNSNPIVLDANGEASIWLGAGLYKFILEDSGGSVQWSVDNVSVDDASGAPTPPWTSHAVTDGQAASSLTDETVNFALYTSGLFDVEIIRGTTVIANGQVAVQNLNGTGRAVAGLFMCSEAHGVTFDVSQSGQVATLRAALSSGPGNGTVKLQRRLIPI